MEYRYITKLQIAELILKTKMRQLQSRYKYLEVSASNCMVDLFYDDDYSSIDYDNEVDQILEERFHIRKELNEIEAALKQVQKEQLYELYPNCESVIECSKQKKKKNFQLPR